MALIASQEARSRHLLSSSASSSSASSLASQPQSVPIHRLRFVDWNPSTVTALAVSPTIDNLTRGILAIGRQNGNIELCTWIGPKPALQSEFSDKAFQSHAAGWVVHTILPGHVNTKIEQLCFANPPVDDDAGIHKLRLFSISGGSMISEHFLPLQLAKFGARAAGKHTEDEAMSKRPGNLSSLFGKRSETNVDPHYPGEIRTLPSLGGAIWSIAPSATGRFLAIGCEDGQARIIDLENDRFEHLASTSGQQRRIMPRFDKAKGRIISLCWGPPVRNSKKKAAKKHATSGSGNIQGDEDSGSDSEDSDDDTNDDSEEDDDDNMSHWYESFLVGGLGTSSAVVWTASTGHIATRLTVQKNRSESTIVWSVATLPDGTIVTGDSTGRVTFFDAQTRTPISGATFSGHASASDVLALIVGPDGRTVYSAGVDQKITEYTKIDTSNGRGQWTQIASRRLHAHDIRAIALDPPYCPITAVEAITQGRSSPEVKRLPVLISGGVDFTLMMTPAAPPSRTTDAMSSAALARMPKGKKQLKSRKLTEDEQKHAAVNPISSNPLTTFADTTQRRIPFVPCTSRSGLLGGGAVAALCPSKGWIVLRREQSIGIWDLGSKQDLVLAATANQAGQPAPQPTWYKLLEMQVKVDSNLATVVISRDGKFLAVSDLYETKLFELKERRLADGMREIEPKKVRSLGRLFGGEERVAPAASALRFSPDSTRLVLCSLTGTYVHVVELPSNSNEDRCRLLRSFGHHRRQAAVSSEQNRQIVGRGKANGINGANGHSNGHEDGASSKQQDRVERTVSTVIHHAEISSDGAWLSTISSDLQHHIFSLDSLTYGRTLPSPHALPTGSVFHPSTSAPLGSMLTLVFPDNKVEFWDVDSGKEMIGATSNENGEVGQEDREEQQQRKKSSSGSTGSTIKSDLIEELTGLKQAIQIRVAPIRDFAISAVWLSDGQGDRLQNYTLLLYGPTWMCSARKLKDTEIEGGSSTTMNGKTTALPRDWMIRLVYKYQSLLLVSPLHLEANQQDHLVIIERPYFELAPKLPPAFYRGAKYGS